MKTSSSFSLPFLLSKSDKLKLKTFFCHAQHAYRQVNVDRLPVLCSMTRYRYKLSPYSHGHGLCLRIQLLCWLDKHFFGEVAMSRNLGTVSDRKHTCSVYYKLLLREPLQYGMIILQHLCRKITIPFLTVKRLHHTCLPVASNMSLYNRFSTFSTVDG